MSLARGLTTINTKKPKAKKLTQKDTERLQLEWRQYNKRMRQQGMRDLQFDTFEDYVAYTRGQYQPSIKSKSGDKTFNWEPKQYRRETTAYKSCSNDAIPTGVCAKPERKEYTGTLIKGIATMHKSNAVPVISKEDAIDCATMRRN